MDGESWRWRFASDEPRRCAQLRSNERLDVATATCRDARGQRCGVTASACLRRIKTRWSCRDSLVDIEPSRSIVFGLIARIAAVIAVETTVASQALEAHRFPQDRQLIGNVSCATDRESVRLSGIARPAISIRSYHLEMRLRRAVPADVGLVRDIVRLAYAKWIPRIGREPRPMHASYEIAIADHIISLCEIEGRPIALIELVPESSHLLVENVAVLPEHQGKGIGDALLRHAEDVARTYRLPELRLYTNAAFTSNLSFYARRGFHVFDREPLATGGELVHLKRDIELDEAPR
jgi:GNAT superfamily N-acetyltransferase